MIIPTSNFMFWRTTKFRMALFLMTSQTLVLGKILNVMKCCHILGIQKALKLEVHHSTFTIDFPLFLVIFQTLDNLIVVGLISQVFICLIVHLGQALEVVYSFIVKGYPFAPYLYSLQGLINKVCIEFPNY